MDAIPGWLFPLAALAILGLQVWQGVRVLRAEGRAIRPALPPDLLFGESGASGCSEVNTIARMAGASRILLVSITKRELAVESAFPFNVFMPRGSFQCRVGIDSIANAYQVDKNSVRVVLPGQNRTTWTLRLYLKHPAQFVRTLNELGVPSNTSLECARGT